jgi:hypothetical protein
MIAGSSKVSHPLSMTRWAALWAVNPRFLVGLAKTHLLSMSTHSNMASYTSPCRSTQGSEKMSRATLDITCVGTGIGTMEVRPLQLGCSHAWRTTHFCLTLCAFSWTLVYSVQTYILYRSFTNRLTPTCHVDRWCDLMDSSTLVSGTHTFPSNIICLMCRRIPVGRGVAGSCVARHWACHATLLA